MDRDLSERIADFEAQARAQQAKWAEQERLERRRQEDVQFFFEREHARQAQLLTYLMFATNPSQRVIDAINGEPMTTTNRVRAGSPPPTVLHRGAPLDLPADDEQGVRNGFDQAMRAPIRKPEPDAETVEQYARDAAEIAWIGWLQIAALLVFIFTGIGYLAGRYFS